MKPAIFITAIFLLLCACTINTQHPIVNLDPAQVKDLLDHKEQQGLFVLNVHTPYQGKIEKTDAIIEDWEHLSLHQDQLPADKKTPILVYCRSGRMSESAAKQLQELGYTDIYQLKGGMIAWAEQNYTILDKTFE